RAAPARNENGRARVREKNCAYFGTSLGLFRMWKAVSNGRSLRSNPPSPLNERLPLFEALKSGNGISLLSANHTLPIAMVRCRTWELTGKILGRLEIVLFRVFLGASR